MDELDWVHAGDRLRTLGLGEKRGGCSVVRHSQLGDLGQTEHLPGIVIFLRAASGARTSMACIAPWTPSAGLC
jgi:hypothetical protein